MCAYRISGWCRAFEAFLCGSLVELCLASRERDGPKEARKCELLWFVARALGSSESQRRSSAARWFESKMKAGFGDTETVRRR